MPGVMDQLKRWRCEECGSKVVLEKKNGQAHVHCNCLLVHALRISSIKLKLDDWGNEISVMGKRIKGIKVAGSVDHRPLSERLLPDPDYED